MATNPIGPGTCNLSVNAPKSWRRFLGRKAYQMNISMGELVRRLVLTGSHVWHATVAAMSARHDDLEALEILRKAISDGIQPEDRPAIERAMELILRSANTDGELATGLDIQKAVYAAA